MNGIQSIGERGRTRLQDQRRLDFVKFRIAHGRYGIPAGPR
jgi:hypothetical protein